MFFISDSNINEAGIFELEITISSSDASDTLNDGLVAHYPFDGTAEDATENENHGDNSGTQFAEDRFGNPESAIAFDGENDSIRVEDSRSLDLTRRMTISFWFFYEPQATSTWYTIFEKTGDADGHARYGAWIIRDLVEVCVEPAVNVPQVGPQLCLDSTTPLIENDWNHVVGTFDGDELRIVLNGEEAGMKASRQTTNISRNDAPMFMGTDLFANTPLFTKMILDELRIYSRVLTDEEIQMLFEG